MDSSIQVDGVEIKDPSPWLAEAKAIAAASKCKVRWMTFRMCKAPERNPNGKTFVHTSCGLVEVAHYETDGFPVEVPMVTRAETELCEKLDMCAAMNLAHVNKIEFIIDHDDDDERMLARRGLTPIESL